MKTLVMMMILTASASTFASTTSFDLIGEWRISGYLYLSALYPRTVNELSISWTFNFDHTSDFTLARESRGEICNEKLTWSLQNDVIVQTVTWVDPENSPDCLKDRDVPKFATSFPTGIKTVGSDLALEPTDKSLPVYYIYSRSGRPGDLTHD